MELGAEKLVGWNDAMDSTTGVASIKRHRDRKLDSRVDLTARDFEILRFILEMKFASSENIYSRFFETTRNGELAQSDQWARKRLRQLEKAGLLRSTYAFAEADRYFVATFQAYYALLNLSTPGIIAKPTASIDQRTFFHDKYLIDLRQELETQKQVTAWISDRLLRSGLDERFGLTSKYVPDAIYRLPAGERVALELEIATKGKSRYQDKIRRYVDLMRSRKNDSEMFCKVHVICLKLAPFEIWKSETRIFASLFQVEYREMPTNLGSR